MTVEYAKRIKRQEEMKKQKALKYLDDIDCHECNGTKLVWILIILLCFFSIILVKAVYGFNEWCLINGF